MQVSSLGQDTNTEEWWAWQGKIYASNEYKRTRQWGRVKNKMKKKKTIKSIRVCSYPRYYKVWRWKYDTSRKLQSWIVSSRFTPTVGEPHPPFFPLMKFNSQWRELRKILVISCKLDGEFKACCKLKFVVFRGTNSPQRSLNHRWSCLSSSELLKSLPWLM